MKKIRLITSTIKVASFCSLLSAAGGAAQTADLPFTIKTDVFDQAKPDNLGLTIAQGTETITVFRPSDSTDHFSNGVVMTGFKGWLYCQWQSSDQSEDTKDTWVAYSRSQDGKSWSSPKTLAAALIDAYCSSGGWWVVGDTLVAYVNVWPSSVSPKGGYVQYATSTDGLSWTALKQLPMANGATMNGIFEQDPHALPDGRIIGAAHFQPGLIASPIYTDDRSGIRGWIRATFTNMTNTGDVSRELEPSWFRRKDGVAVMVFRDQNSSFRRLASISTNRGSSWSTPVVTDMPDSRSKQSAGNLPDSTAYMVGNPVENKTRIPLVITLSSDGKTFDKAYVLRQGGSDLQAQRYAGTSKGVGYIYPKSMVWREYLYVAYSTNKEDVEYTRVPLSGISLNNPTSVHSSSSLSNGRKMKIFAGANGIIKVSKPNHHGEGMVNVFSLNGQLIYQRKMINGEVYLDMARHAAGPFFIEMKTNSGEEIELFN
jgi:hypothetical protein